MLICQAGCKPQRPAGALAIGMASLLQNAPAHADSADQAAVDKAVEALRKALLDAD